VFFEVLKLCLRKHNFKTIPKMRQFVNHKSINLGISKKSQNIEFEILYDTDKIATLVASLKLLAQEDFIQKEILYIPDECEKYGFAEGYHNLGILFDFLADMLEE
jgi:hypothetical protein